MISVALILLLVSILFRIFSPKKINLLYGYRTTSAMRNIESWKVANKYSATLMIVFFSIISIIAFILNSVNGNYESLIFILIVLAFIAIIILTERKIKTVK